MNEIKNDINLREAVNRKEQKLPQMPSDLNERVLNSLIDTPSRPRRTPLLSRGWWIAAAAVLVAVLALFTWKSQTPKTQPQIAKQENAPKVIEKDSVDKSPTTHVKLSNNTREVEQQHTRRLETPQPKKKNRKAVKVQDTPVEEPLLAEAEPVQEEKKQEYQSLVSPVPTQNEDLEPYLVAAAQAQDIRSRGKRLSQEVALLMEQ